MVGLESPRAVLAARTWGARVTAAELLASAAEDAPAEGAVERAIAVVSGELATWRPGKTWWFGDSCLECTGIDRNGSRQSRVVATFDELAKASRCPCCGAVVEWDSAPGIHDDPRCCGCQCPPTMRDQNSPARGTGDVPAVAPAGATIPAQAGEEP